MVQEMKFVLCSSWSLPVQPRGAQRPLCSALWTAQAPHALSMTTSACTALLGPFCSTQGTRGEKLPCHFSVPPPAMSSQVGNDTEISLDISFRSFGKSPSCRSGTGQMGVTGPSGRMGRPGASS